MALKWDRSYTRRNALVGRTERVREMTFQDHTSVQELTDVDNRFMELREFGRGFILANAYRDKRTWVCTRWDEDGPNHYWALTKERAVDFLLGR